MSREQLLGSLVLAIAIGLPSIGHSQTGTTVASQTISHNTPRFVTSAKNLGPAKPGDVIDVAIWLNPHNRAELDTLAEDLYDPSSSHYRDWLKPADIAARFAPSAQEAQTVAKFLSSHNLPVVSIGPDNFYVRARGAVADVERTFKVQLRMFEVNGKTIRANTTDPSVDAAIAPLVGSVSGLDSLEYTHPVAAQLQPKASKGGDQKAPTQDDPTFFTTNCFTAAKTESFTGVDFYGFSASATYKGNTYNGTNNIAGCGYTPPEIWTAYNLTGLYKEGFDGTGQTIVIIDWCGSPTIKADANAFSAKFGLPALTSANFQILYSNTVPTCAAPDPEINIDVEWAHAIAPGAKIALVVPPSSSFMDVDDGELYAIANGLGNTISGSYGSEELYTPEATLNEENLINQLAAISGISANFASGDYGDYTFGYPASNPASVSAPASSTYATAVGGVTLALKTDNTMSWQTGWGTNQNPLVVGTTIFAPPTGYFDFGSGGGPSGFFSKPSFQKKLPGKQRLLPDISWLADPYTGGVIAISEPFTYPTIEYQVYGGTSLATPMFSGLWAIAIQEAGVPLGQAARHLYTLPEGTITDVLPHGASHNVTGVVTDSFFDTTTSYTADELAAPLAGNSTFLSALWDYPLYQETFLLTFGTDSGLRTTTGWDSVTGLGTPNGKKFADYFNPASDK